jgi:hypothetical protein
MFRHVAMQDPPGTNLHRNKEKQYPERRRATITLAWFRVKVDQIQSPSEGDADKEDQRLVAADQGELRQNPQRRRNEKLIHGVEKDKSKH